MIVHQKFSITGVANQTVYDAIGLESTVKAPKKLLSCLVQVSKYASATVEGWAEKARVFEVPDSIIDTVEREADSNMNKSATRINEIPVDLDMEVGLVFKAAIVCGATPVDLVGDYIYEVGA